ncbi:hypothetical protein DOJK_01862 [Patescibacteria group bacterium]|nr:hypothetical protein DOJK_01862 [Patescibacteria group bacterium]
MPDICIVSYINDIITAQRGPFKESRLGQKAILQPR